MPIRLALNELPSQRAIIALACALALASRCGGEDTVGVCIRHGSLLERIAGFEQIFADAVPVILRLDGDRGEVSNVRRLQDRLDEIMRTRLTFAWDILLRHPPLHKIAAIANRTLLPLMVEQVTPGIAPSPLPASDLSLLVGLDDLRWSFASTSKPARIALIEARLPSYLAEAIQCA